MKVIKFSSKTCVPCEQYKPIFDIIKNKYPHIEFQEVSIESNPELTLEYKVKSVPTTIFIKNNQIFNRQIGKLSEYQLEQFVKQLQ